MNDALCFQEKLCSSMNKILNLKVSPKSHQISWGFFPKSSLETWHCIRTQLIEERDQKKELIPYLFFKL